METKKKTCPKCGQEDGSGQNKIHDMNPEHFVIRFLYQQIGFLSQEKRLAVQKIFFLKFQNIRHLKMGMC